MKIIITGSTGHISRPLTQILTAAGHDVTVVTSSTARTADIEALGAKAAVGSLTDAAFVTAVLRGADSAYLMMPPNLAVPDLFAHQKSIADVYARAVKESGIRRVVLLSSIGAHRGEGTGPIDGSAYFERVLSPLSGGVSIHVLRPGYFYYNMLGLIGMIKSGGIIGSSQPADFRHVLVHPTDIAAAAAKAVGTAATPGVTVEYIASDDTHTWAEIAHTLGAAIGKPELPYVEYTDEQMQGGLEQAGLPKGIAAAFMQMNKALREGIIFEDFKKHTPTYGKVKLQDYAKEFAAVYRAS
ncbi:MAG: NmrA family NAD(P)-binding protein [Bacteroidetes bacterium]|nr:NmrA family NAD(P)-binding protein [Bacteroidota bacterium]